MLRNIAHNIAYTAKGAFSLDAQYLVDPAVRTVFRYPAKYQRLVAQYDAKNAQYDRLTDEYEKLTTQKPKDLDTLVRQTKQMGHNLTTRVSLYKEMKELFELRNKATHECTQSDSQRLQKNMNFFKRSDDQHREALKYKDNPFTYPIKVVYTFGKRQIARCALNWKGKFSEESIYRGKRPDFRPNHRSVYDE